MQAEHVPLRATENARFLNLGIRWPFQSGYASPGEGSVSIIDLGENLEKISGLAQSLERPVVRWRAPCQRDRKLNIRSVLKCAVKGKPRKLRTSIPVLDGRGDGRFWLVSRTIDLVMIPFVPAPGIPRLRKPRPEAGSVVCMSEQRGGSLRASSNARPRSRPYPKLPEIPDRFGTFEQLASLSNWFYQHISDGWTLTVCITPRPMEETWLLFSAR